ncbi:MAG TPA: FAD-dependent oxidoreductase [Methanomassiliicoccales archaeon]
MVIIGGGTAGTSAALSLAERGIPCTIVERSPRLGGLASDLACKGRVKCVNCDVCMSTERLPGLFRSGMIKMITSSEVATIERDLGIYRVTVVPGRSIDPMNCDGCGDCADVCPPKAIEKVPGSDDRWRVATPSCPFPVEGCTSCVDVCSRDAVRTGPAGCEITADVIIVAIGSDPFKAQTDPRLGYGTVKGVITGLDAESELNRSGSLDRFCGGGPPKSIAFIQCVGSRGRPGTEQCSKVCCKYSIKLAQSMRAADAGLDITFFMMDWRRYVAEDSITDLARSDPKLAVLRSRPAEAVSGESGRPAVRYAMATDDGVNEKEFDLVILSIGLLPSASGPDIASSLGVRLSPHGFFMSEGNPGRMTDAKGLFFCGSCSGPKDIEECVMDGSIAAGKASAYLEGLK